MIKKILCFLGFHKTKLTHKNRGIAGGWHCTRPGCGFKVDAIRWPREPRAK